MTAEIQGHFIIRPQQVSTATGVVELGTVTSPVGGAATNFYCALGTSKDFTAVAAALETALDAAVGGAGTWTVAWTGATFTIERADDAQFDCAFNYGLQRHCGFASSYGARADRTIATSGTPWWWWKPTYSLEVPDCWYEYRRMESASDYGEPLGTLLSTRTYFKTALYYDVSSEAAQVTRVLGYMRTGAPFRLWLNTSDNTAWSETNRDGYLDLRVTAETSATVYASDPSTAVGRLELTDLFKIA